MDLYASALNNEVYINISFCKFYYEIQIYFYG